MTNKERYERSTYTEARDKALKAVASAEMDEAYLTPGDDPMAPFMEFVPAEAETLTVDTVNHGVVTRMVAQ